MESKIVLDGRFRVTTDGDVYRIKNGEETPASIFMTSRDRRYCTICYTVNGKQKHEYVHRLVAGAFIPNPDNLPQVNHIDGNPTNNKVDNLQWCTPAQNIRHAYENGLISSVKNSVPCAVCGAITLSKTQMCGPCRRHLVAEQKRTEREEAVAEELNSLDQSLLTPREREYIKLRAEGLMLREIAEVYGVSRQNVHEALRKAMLRQNPEGASQIKMTRQERLRVEARLERNRQREVSIAGNLERVREQISDDIARLGVYRFLPLSIYKY